MISFELMHPYSTLNVLQIIKLGCSEKKNNNNKYVTFNINLNVLRSVQMTWAKDLWIYGPNTQIVKYIVGGTQKPL